MHHTPRLASALALLFLLLAAAAPAAGPARVETFAPQGFARAPRQVSARFSEPMVPLGDPRPAADPFQVDCAVPGSARWADGRTWVHSFERDLPGGLRCRFSLRDGVRTLGGGALGGARSFELTTGGPGVVDVEPSGGSVAEDQRFAVRLDAAPDPASLERHVALRIQGLPDPVGVRVLAPGPERDALLRSLRWKPDDPEVVVLEPRQALPPGAGVVLVWGAGVAAAATGVSGGPDQRFDFAVRPAFSARLACDRERAEADCVPLAPIRLLFSAPVAWAQAERIALRELAADGAVGPGRWAARRLDPASADPLVDAVEFLPPFPPHAELAAELPQGLADDAGRALPEAVAAGLALRTAGAPPLARFSARFGILESAVPVLPVALRRVEADAGLRAHAVTGALGARAFSVADPDAAAVLAWLDAVERARPERSLFAAPPLPAEPRELALPPPAEGEEAEVVGIPLPGPGLHVVEIESRVLGAALLAQGGPMHVAAAALVTNLGVHFKWGHESSLVWVTALDSAAPVAGARVRVADCHGEVLAEAQTDAQGLARIGGLPGAEDAPSCDADDGWSEYRAGLLALADRGGDLGLAHSSWSEGLEPWRFDLPTEWRPRELVAHTVLDRALLRAGDTLHMKHLLRRPALAGFAQVPAAGRPDVLRISHLGSDDAWELPLAWSADGSALTDWQVPVGAKLGSYQLQLVPPGAESWQAETSGTFRVEEFRVPLARAVIQPPGEALVAPSEVPLELAVQYLAGGAASSLPVVLRSQVRRRASTRFSGYEDFAFGAGGVEEGVRARRFGEGEPDWEQEWAWSESGALGVLWRRPETAPGRGPVNVQELTLDAVGTGRAVLAGLPRADEPLELVAELEFRDPSGQAQTASRTLPLWPAARAVGLRASSATSPREAVRLRAVVLDLSGDPVWRARVEIDAFERRHYATRKRVVGGFYAYEHVEEVRRLGAFCSGRSDRAGFLACEAPPPASGDLVFVARTRDGDGRESVTQVAVWVPGGEDDWSPQADGDRMDLLPDRRRYEPGDTAKLRVAMPFRTATALVSVEREGVGEAFVVPLSGRAPEVELPIRAAHAPNVFVSVLAVRGRAAEPAPTAWVDLGKPAYRLGMTELRVGWGASELSVEVAPEREVYRVRETARVRVRVRGPGGAPPPPGSELAVAAVDEGLLELAPNPSWRLLDAFMGRRMLDVTTATAQMQVVGRRHYGRKALPAGGGGGQRPTRELFDTLLSWQGRVALDARGDAWVEIPTNDSLTSFRIAALATGGTGLFGSGEAVIRTTQDLMLLSGLPPLVRSGDRFAAGFTLRNTTDSARDVSLRARVEGLAQTLAPQSLALAPGEARELSFLVEVPDGVDALDWQLELESAGQAADRLRVRQRVAPAVPERVLQAALLQVPAAGAALEVERPAGALAGRGGLAVALRPRLADGRDAIEREMRAYPYTCLEQKASVAVALRDAERWRAAMETLPAHLDGDGLAKFFPVQREGSEVLTAYLLALGHEAGFELPAPARERMLAALERFAQGGLSRVGPPRAADLPLRKLAAAEALARHGKATPALVAALAVEPALLPDSALLDWLSVLERTPDLPRRAARVAEAERLLRARLDVQGSALGFASGRGGSLDWLLATTDANAARLVLSRLAAPGWRDDAPRLVRGLLALQRRGAWPTTLANAWGVLALEKFSRAYEATPVAGETGAALAAARETLSWAATPEGGVLRLPWPDARGPLALSHAGAGAPWALVQGLAALPLREPLESGYRIARTLSPVARRTPDAWSRGDVLRVRVEVESDADAAWVVVSDPVPAGATILGSGLGGDSALLSAGERAAGFAWPAFTERGQEVLRQYYEFVPKGRLAFEYTLRLEQVGTFLLPPTRVEAMYAPERMGERPNEPLAVAP
jgi:hypothetical protein